MIAPHDLVVLAADKDTEHTLRALLGRSRAMEIRAVSHDIKVHPNRDPGCIHADEFLRSFSRQFHHALVVFDREGCGVESSTREEIEGEVERRLRISGWDDRAAVVVLDPEIECWVWSESPHVDTALGWEKRVPPLRTWLMNKGLLRDGERKPGRPEGGDACGPARGAHSPIGVVVRAARIARKHDSMRRPCVREAAPGAQRVVPSSCDRRLLSAMIASLR